MIAALRETALVLSLVVLAGCALAAIIEFLTRGAD